MYPGADITLCGALCAIMQFCSQNFGHLSFQKVLPLQKILRNIDFQVLCPTSSSLCCPQGVLVTLGESRQVESLQLEC